MRYQKYPWLHFHIVQSIIPYTKNLQHRHLECKLQLLCNRWLLNRDSQRARSIHKLEQKFCMIFFVLFLVNFLTLPSHSNVRLSSVRLRQTQQNLRFTKAGSDQQCATGFYKNKPHFIINVQKLYSNLLFVRSGFTFIVFMKRTFINCMATPEQYEATVLRHFSWQMKLQTIIKIWKWKIHNTEVFTTVTYLAKKILLLSTLFWYTASVHILTM